MKHSDKFQDLLLKRETDRVNYTLSSQQKEEQVQLMCVKSGEEGTSEPGNGSAITKGLSKCSYNFLCQLNC